MATVARRCEGVGAGARRSQVIFLPASGILPPDSSGFVISPFLQNTVQTLIEWIDEHIDQPLNIDIVARKSGYSKWYLQRMFRTVMHQTLGDYIRQRRLLLAAEALRTTQRPIFDIAMDLGYVSQQTFSRVFRREFDRTPSDYRHQISA
ncbi:Regulatory protein SoxS [Klebsiella pneumoniae]|nr:Regulatory protein SoxS [Klebsiella pneumoniae]